MSDTPTDVFVGGYRDIDEATKDFDALAELVKDKKVKIEAAILITHAEDGTVGVQQTADHRGRKGVQWGRCSCWRTSSTGLSLSSLVMKAGR
jgi:uncharacterized membrane protein